MYIPAEDSYLLAEIVKLYNGEYALEIGVGTGIVLDKLCDSFKVVIGTDIHFDSLIYCHNNISKAVSLVCCDAASALIGKFDLIVSNPPYLPQDSIGTSDSAIYGGLYGYELVLHFVRSSLPLLNIKGKILIVVSNLSNMIQINSLVEPMNLDVRIVGRKKLFFETLFVFEISKKH
ncbi:MAG TPA: HemK2/MTQ2 family protein methyltransferase [Nitrososphaeraceae archaeon]